jgi:hypothetical protein
MGGQPLPQDEIEDLYETLQVSPRAHADVIEAAYRVLARRYHPDRNRSPEATSLMARLNVAWETLQDPQLRAEYDQTRAPMSLTAVRGPARPSPTAPGGDSAGRRAYADTPALGVEPGKFEFGVVRRGSRRSAAASVRTEPPGIRVEAVVGRGGSWLSVSPSILKGLDKDQILVQARTRGLPPGEHTGSIDLLTSWETRSVPVSVTVRRSTPVHSLLSLVRYGPHGDQWRGSTIMLIVAIVVLLGTVAGLGALAIGR